MCEPVVNTVRVGHPPVLPPDTYRDCALNVRMDVPAPIAAKLTARRRLPVPAMRRALRIDAGLTQADVGETLGVARESVARWEAGARTPRGEILLAYVDLLDELRSVQQ